MKDIAVYTESLHTWPRHTEYAARPPLPSTRI